MEVLYGTGLRNEELCDLLVEDADLVRRQLTIRRGRPRGQGRVLPLSDVCVLWLGRYLDQVRPGLSEEGERHLFLSTQRRAMERGSLTDIVRRNARKAGLERTITPHVLRHCCAAHMLRHRAGIRHIQELLGHASADSTQRYTRVEVSDLRRVLRRCHPREQKR
jgi:integrase/recombinase XerD